LRFGVGREIAEGAAPRRGSAWVGARRTTHAATVRSASAAAISWTLVGRVIPEKAAIQGNRRTLGQVWLPACVGMTPCKYPT
jgi:hypothetical protein